MKQNNFNYICTRVISIAILVYIYAKKHMTFFFIKIKEMKTLFTIYFVWKNIGFCAKIYAKKCGQQKKRGYYGL